MSAAYLESLRLLALNLETLKLHGHRHVAADDLAGWRAALASKLKKLKGQAKPKARASAAIPAMEPAPGGPQTLDDIRREVENCQKCRLAKTRANTVFGVGDPKARLMFIGEGPGADEDAQGEPFVGRAGKLLNEMIAAMGLTRDAVYIANIVKCRPPQNRDPEPDEAAMCKPYLLRQIDLIRPEFICALGAVPARNLLGTEETIGKLRGSFHSLGGSAFLATYHPSYLLRNQSAKAESWKDLQLLMKRMGLKDPRKKNE
jgi:DNA polymerase